MEDDLQNKLSHLEAKISAIQQSVDKTCRYMRTMTYISIAVIILPVIGLIIVIPIVLNILRNAYSGIV